MDKLHSKYVIVLSDKAASKIEKVLRDFRRAKSGKITTSSEKDWSQQVEHMQVRRGRDQVSGGVSVPCQHATPVADVPWKPIFSDVKFSKKSNQGKCHELVVSIQGNESS